MNKYFLIIALLSSLAQKATAQIEFFKTYGLPNRTEQLVSIKPAATSGQYWVAGTTGSVGHDDFFINLLDSNAQSVQSDTFGSALYNELLYDFDYNSTSNVSWLAGSRRPFGTTSSQPMLLAINADGQTIAQVFGTAGWSNNYAYKTVRALDDGGALAVSSVDGSVHTFERLNAIGAKVWEKQFTESAFLEPTVNLAAYPDGHSFFLRNFNTYNPSTRRLELYYLDPTGALLWTKSISNPGGELSTFGEAVAIDPTDGNLLLLHYQRGPWKWFLSKLDQAGNLLWQQELATPLPGTQPARLATGLSGTLGIVFKEGIEVRNGLTGIFLSSKSFAPVQGYSTTYFKGGVMRADSSLVLAAHVERNEGSGDGYFAQFSLPDYTVNAETYIGQEGVNDLDDSPRVAVGADGAWYVGNRAHYGAIKYGDFALRKIDASGNLLWERNYGTEADETFSDLTLLTDGHCLLTGSAYRMHDTLPDFLILLNLDADGSVIWERRLPRKTLNPNIHVVALPDGGCVVLFNSQFTMQPSMSTPMQAIRFAANGDSLWHNRYFQNVINPSDNNRGSVQFTALPDGTLLSVGTCSNCTGNILRLNPIDGTAILEKDIEINVNYAGRRATSGVLAINGDLLVMCTNYSHLDSVYLYRLSPSGNILQRKGLKIGEYHYASSILRLSDGGLAAIIAHNFSNVSNSPDGLFVRRMSEAFEPLGADLVLANEERRPQDAVALPGGGLALVGFMMPTNSADIFLLKVSAIPTVSTTNLGTDDNGLRVFPNPIAKDRPLQIVLENDYLGTVKIEILSLDGRVFNTILQEKTTREMSRTIPSSDIWPSQFIVRVSDEKRSVVQLVYKF